MQKSILGRRNVAEDALIRDVRTGGISHHIECSQERFAIGGNAKYPLPLAARFRADEIR